MNDLIKMAFDFPPLFYLYLYDRKVYLKKWQTYDRTLFSRLGNWGRLEKKISKVFYEKALFWELIVILFCIHEMLKSPYV